MTTGLQEASRLRSEVQRSTERHDELEGRLATETSKFQEMAKARMSATASLVKALARKELEFRNMKIQVNNQRLGVVVRADASVTENALEYFEPGFAFHHLQSVRPPPPPPGLNLKFILVWAVLLVPCFSIIWAAVRLRQSTLSLASRSTTCSLHAADYFDGL